jgi:thiol-disulfide isomerase/thioredoxin
MLKTKILFLFIFAVCAAPVSAQIYVAEDAVKTTVINSDELKELVKSPERKKPVLVNLWATWCGICRREFPKLVEIDKDYRERGLDFFIVSIDTVSLVDTTVSDFLKVYQITMPSYLLDAPSRYEINDAVSQIVPRFAGGFPTTLLFNKNGKLVYQKTGTVDPKILRTQIEKVLPKDK